MKFTVKERIGISNVIPQSGSIDKQMIARDILQKAEFTDDERTIINLQRHPDGRISWNPSRESLKEIELTDVEIALLKNQVKELDEQELINQDTLDICLKINAL